MLEPERSTPAERLQAGAGELRMGVYVGADEGIEKGQEILISFVLSPLQPSAGDKADSLLAARQVREELLEIPRDV